MVASPSREPMARQRGGRLRGLRQPSATVGLQQRSLQLIQGSLSANRVARQAPWLSSLHRAADGTLAGLGVCMLALSGLTLHWQTQWGNSYRHLETAQVLQHRLQESAALLEQHHLKTMGRPGSLVPTSSQQLLYMEAPKPAAPTASIVPFTATKLLSARQLRQIPAGY